MGAHLTGDHPGKLVGGAHEESTKDLLVDVALLRMHVHGGAHASATHGNERRSICTGDGVSLERGTVQFVGVGKHAGMQTADVLAVEQEGLLLARRHLFERRSGLGALAILVALAHRKQRLLRVGLEYERRDALAAERVGVARGHGEATRKADLVGLRGRCELLDAHEDLHAARADVDHVAAQTVVGIGGERRQEVESIHRGGHNVDGRGYFARSTAEGVLV